MISAKVASTVLAFVASGAWAVSWASSGPEAPPVKGPYKAVISKPVPSPGHTVGTLYGEHEYLTSMLNQLDADGLKPVMTQVLPFGTGSAREELRLLMVCVEK
jgi:hypothetical protein